MLVFLTGVPGSGKTYFSIYYLFKNFGSGDYKLPKIKFPFFDNENYDFAYTNIANLKKDYFIDDMIKDFNYQNFYIKISALYNLYKTLNDDEKLIEEAKKLDLYNCLFVIDEAHNFFNKENDILIWWITYHRHLHQDILFITQNIALINKKYKQVSESFIKARPATMKIVNLYMDYFIYSNPQLFQNSKVGSLKLPIKKYLFDIYSSGKAQKPKSFIQKYFKYAFLLLLFILFMIYRIYIYFYPTNETKKNNEIETNQIQAIHHQNQSLHSIDSLKNHHSFNSSDDSGANFSSSFHSQSFSILRFVCIKNICYLKNQRYPFSFLLFLKEKYKFDTYIDKIDNSNYFFFVVGRNSILHMFDTKITYNKGLKNEKVHSLPFSVH